MNQVDMDEEELSPTGKKKGKTKKGGLDDQGDLGEVSPKSKMAKMK